MDDNHYLSPFGTRYGSQVMAAIWSEGMKRQLWREAWHQLLVQQQLDQILPLDSPQQKALARRVLLAAASQAEIDGCQAIEQRLKHDLASSLEWVRQQLRSAGYEHPERVHLAVTSSDIEDYADARRIALSSTQLQRRLLALAESIHLGFHVIETVVTVGKTHLQDAEPTTIGYRLAVYLQQLARLTSDFRRQAGIWDELQHRLSTGGAVGTHGTLTYILDHLHLGPHVVDHYQTDILRFQTQPRIIELSLVSSLSTLAAWLHKIAFDLRIMQADGLLREYKTSDQVGSSAMPGKANPITSEKVCSLARHVHSLASEAWDYSANSLLERTLDDSASRRFVLPELFLAMDEMVLAMTQVFDHLQVSRAVGNKSISKAECIWVPARLYGLLRALGNNLQQKELVDDLVKNGRVDYRTLRDRYKLEKPGWSVEQAMRRAQRAADLAMDSMRMEAE